MNMFNISYESEILLMSKSINHFVGYDGMYFNCDSMAISKYLVDCGFINSVQIALYIAYFPFSVFCNMERIQKRIDVPFKEWGSIFNMPEKLYHSVKALRDNVPLYKITKFQDSWSKIPY